MHRMFLPPGKGKPLPITFVHAGIWDSTREGLDQRNRAFVNAANFEPKPGRHEAGKLT